MLPDHVRTVTGVTQTQLRDDRDNRRDQAAFSPAADTPPDLERPVFPPDQHPRPEMTGRARASGLTRPATESFDSSLWHDNHPELHGLVAP